ncbi:MAG: 50S ribosomal protein L32 [Holosporaceae bacterium]|nr:50S ribosomal protein L32 [Holosporaceae bacterium]
MAVPKKKISKSRRNMRRSHLALTPVGIVVCSNCGESKLPHHLCANCGQYNGRQILKDKRQSA